MKLPAFDYLRPLSVADATAALRDEEARVLAGGQSLIPLMALRLARPERLVDVTRIAELRGIQHDPATGLLRVGAAVTHRELINDRVVRSVAPFLAVIGAHVGHEAIRVRGTFGGSIAHADPAAEWPALAVAVGATMELRSHDGGRRVPAVEFFDGAYTTTISPGEMLAAVEIELGAIQSVGFAEVSRRPGDFALAGAVWVVTGDPRRGTEHSVTVFGLTYQPVRIAVAAGPPGAGTRPGDLVARATALAREISNVRCDLHASEQLRLHLAGEMIARACASAFEQTGGSNAR